MRLFSESIRQAQDKFSALSNCSHLC